MRVGARWLLSLVISLVPGFTRRGPVLTVALMELCLVVRGQHGSQVAFQFGFEVLQDSLFCLVRELHVFVRIQARDELVEDQHVVAGQRDGRRLFH